MIKYKDAKVIEVNDWDELVEDTYGRPYNYQQQDGCMDRGSISITIPSETTDEEMNDSISEEVNGEEMKVKFSVWLSRDPEQSIENQKYDWELTLFWERNFYPDIQMVANDLHQKGLIEAGEYTINIDW